MMENIDENKIAKIIENYQKGFYIQPILALRDGTVIDGAHRVIAFRKLNLPINVVYIDGIVESIDGNHCRTWLDDNEEELTK